MRSISPTSRAASRIAPRVLRSHWRDRLRPCRVDTYRAVRWCSIYPRSPCCACQRSPSQAPGADPLEQSQAAMRLVQMVGEFEKPRYVQYEICAHSRKTQTGCTRASMFCARSVRSATKSGRIPSCAWDAVTAPLRVRPARCVLRIPAWPTSTQLRKLLSVYRGPAARTRRCSFHNGKSGRALISRLARVGKGLPARVVPIEVHSVAAIGIDVVLGAIAYGGADIRCSTTLAPTSTARCWSSRRVSPARSSMDWASGTHWQTVRAEEPRRCRCAVVVAAAASVAEPAKFHLSNRKRETLDFAIDHLVRQASMLPEQIALPAVRRSAPSPSTRLAAPCARCAPARVLRCRMRRTHQAALHRASCAQCGLCEITWPSRRSAWCRGSW